MKVSELYGKPIKGANGKRSAFILGVNINEDGIDGLICCDENEKTFFVASENVTALCGDTRYLKTDKAQKNAASLRLGKAVFTADGKFLGYLQDCVLNGLKISYALVGGKKIPFKDICHGDVCIVKSKSHSAELAAKNMFIRAVCDGEDKKAE